jgi:hypothetical protein
VEIRRRSNPGGRNDDSRKDPQFCVHVITVCFDSKSRAA